MADIAKQMEDVWNDMLKQIEPDIKSFCQIQCNKLWVTAWSEMTNYGVTGNLFNSLVVGCYKKGELICFANAESAGIRDATRMTLKRGEKYNLPYYWSGGSTYGGKRAFVAPTGTENYDGRSRGKRLLWSAKTNKDVLYRFVIGVPVEYARYLETKGTHNILTRLHDELASAGAEVSRMHYT